MNGIKAILFDIDDTLFASTQFSQTARANAINAMIDAGLQAKESDAKKELQSIIKELGSNSAKHFNELASRFKCKDKDHCIAAGVWAYHNTKSSISTYPRTASTLLELRESGFVVCAASEGKAIKQWDKLIRLGIDNMFDHVFVTNSKEGSSGVLFYRSISKILGLMPNNILMVGDNPKKDILTAKKAGFRTIRLKQGKYIKNSCTADISLKNICQIPKILQKPPKRHLLI
jgi:putative hydrolase of the HAD superfamily